MSDFASLAAPPTPLSLAGRQFLCAPLRFCDHAEAAQQMRQNWPSSREVIRHLGRGLPPDQQRILLELAYREERLGLSVELADVLRWYRTPEGLVFRQWLMLRRHHPELTLADVDELLTCASEAELPAAIRVASEAEAIPAGNAFAPSAAVATGPHPENSIGPACSTR